MRWLMVALLLVGVALLLGWWVVFYPHAGSFSQAAHWERVWVKDPGVGGYAGTLSDMDFVDARQGWIGHSGQPLLRTSDGGSTWTDQYAPSPKIFLGCFDFLDERVGWAVESGWPSRTVGVTIDGGASWQISPLRAECDLQELTAVSATEAWAIGPLFPRKRLFHTVDGGVTWSEVNYPVSREGVHLEAIRFLDRTHGWIVAAERVLSERPPAAEARPVFILRTTDGGKSFGVSTIAPGGSAESCRLEFRNRREGWVTLGSASLLHTTDGGKTWDRVAPPHSVLGGKTGTPAQVHLRDCSFPTPKSGWVVGDVGHVEALALHTADGGKTWRRELTGTETLYKSRLDRVVFADEKHGWAYGEGGDPGDDMTGRRPHWMTFILRYVP